MGFLSGSDGDESACLQETHVPLLGNPVEKGLAIYSGILDWRIPWKEEPGGLQSMGVTKSWKILSDNTHTHTNTFIFISIKLI